MLKIHLPNLIARNLLQIFFHIRKLKSKFKILQKKKTKKNLNRKRKRILFFRKFFFKIRKIVRRVRSGARVQVIITAIRGAFLYQTDRHPRKYILSSPRPIRPGTCWKNRFWAPRAPSLRFSGRVASRRTACRGPVARGPTTLVVFERSGPVRSRVCFVCKRVISEFPFFRAKRTLGRDQGRGRIVGPRYLRGMPMSANRSSVCCTNVGPRISHPRTQFWAYY